MLSNQPAATAQVGDAGAAAAAGAGAGGAEQLMNLPTAAAAQSYFQQPSMVAVDPAANNLMMQAQPQQQYILQQPNMLAMLGADANGQANMLGLPQAFQQGATQVQPAQTAAAGLTGVSGVAGANGAAGGVPAGAPTGAAPAGGKQTFEGKVKGWNVQKVCCGATVSFFFMI